jgi:hypothetical protein
MQDEGLNTMRSVASVCKVPLGAGVQRLLVPGVVVVVFLDRRSEADWVEATR